ncbi:MAG: hypothetical protein U0469_02650 [Candidatus Paceibacterota bacterium]|jgi:GH24 family phage-related lysozyme (muramidase)
MFLNTQNKNSFGKKMFSLLFFLFIFIANFNSVKISHAAPATDPTYEDTVKYPRIELAVNASLAADKEKLFITSLKNHKCLDSSYNIDTAVMTNTSLNAINSFRNINGITQEKNVGIYTWEALMLKAGEKTKSGDLVFDCGDKTANGGSLGGAVQTYQNISSFSGEATSTTFTNTNTGGLGDAFNYILTLMAVAIIVLVAFRIIEGAITKGAFENIYDQQKGKKLMETAGKALLIFILAYAVLSFINPDLTGWTFIQSVTGLGSTGSSNNGDCGSIAGYTKTDIENMLLQDEGSKTTAYYDTKGIPTIGVGYNLIRNNNVKQELIAAGVDEANASKLASLTKDPSKAGKQVPGYTITPDQVKKLLEKDLGTFTAIAKRVSEKNGINFESLPLNVKNVLIDMSYAGEGTFDDFKNMLKFVKEGNYVKAAGQIKYSDLEETKISPYCSQTGDRCGRLVGLMAGQCKSTIQTNNNQESLSNISQDRLKNIQDLANKSLDTPCPNNSESKIIDSNYRANGINKPKIKLCRLHYIKGDLLPKMPASDNKGAFVNSLVAQKFENLGKAYYDQYKTYLTSNASTRIADSCGSVGGSGCASPGTSPHQLGAAIDFNSAGADNGKPGYKPGATCSNPATFNSQQQIWLRQNAAKYGVRQIPSESWHFEGLQISLQNC